MTFKGGWGLLKAAAINWSEDQAPRLGAALSYYTLFALSPLLIIVIFIASLWLDQASVRSHLFDELAGLVGKRGAEALQTTLTSAIPKDQGLVASAIALGTLLLTATGLFIELQAALNRIWGVVEKPGQGIWGFVKNRLLSFAMVLGIGFLLLVSLVLSAALSAVGKYIGALVPGLAVFWIGLNALLSIGVITVLFAMIFKVLPDVRIAWRDVWVGAAITAVLFTAGKFLLGWYLGRSSTVSAYGAAGSIVLLLLWVYYSAQILFFGAEFTQAYANQYGARFEPKNNAKWIVPESDQPKKPGNVPLRQPPDRKTELLEGVREQVESLRATVKARHAQ
jgi:membrane protein